MRREWSNWIRTRQWLEFERLAKLDPSQGLADTIAELELGFPDRTDKRALRKVLYLLSQAGFEPREIEEFAAGMDVPPAPMEAAFMVSSDGLGDSVITYGKEDRGRVGWIVAHVNFRKGVTRAVEDATTIDEANTKLIRLRNLKPTPYVSAEVPPGFALARLSRAVDISKTLPPVMAYWRSILPKDAPTTHPTDTMARQNVNQEAMIQYLKEENAAQIWRLELGMLAPTLTELIGDADTADSERPPGSAKWNEIMETARQSLFMDTIVLDHRMRLLDLAYLSHLNGISDCAVLLSLADDLHEKGPDSLYATEVTNRSLAIFINALRAANSKERQ